MFFGESEAALCLAILCIPLYVRETSSLVCSFVTRRFHWFWVQAMKSCGSEALLPSGVSSFLLEWLAKPIFLQEHFGDSFRSSK